MLDPLCIKFLDFEPLDY